MVQIKDATFDRILLLMDALIGNIPAHRLIETAEMIKDDLKAAKGGYGHGDRSSPTKDGSRS